MTSVVTELVIDPDGANQGAASFDAAMAKASKAANDNLKSIADSTAALNRQMGGLSDATKSATDNAGGSWGGFVTKVAVGAAAAALGIGALYTAFKIIYEVVTAVPRLLEEAWDLGNAKLAEYVALADKAAASGLSTDFYQRISKAATDTKVPIDDLTAAFKKLADATADQLGGSVGQKRLDELTKAGNFQGNTGVSQFAAANTTEDKFRAIVSLIDQAMAKGERLAALDVSKTFLGDAVTTALSKDQDYLNRMLESADKIKADKLVSDADVGNAVELQNRLDAAEKILSQRWHPIQDILVQGGINMKEAWVSIVEAIASAVDGIVKLIEKLGQVPAWFYTKLNQAATWFTDATTTPEGRAAAEKANGITSDPQEMAMLAAQQQLAARLRNPVNAAQSTDQINAVQRAIFRDTSKDPDAKKVEDDTSAYDRATESLLKYISTTNAAAETVGKSATEQEKAKAMAQLLAAAEKDGTTVTAQLRTEMDGLASRAAAAAEALAKAKIAADIKYNSQTALLSQEDVQIATQLKTIYPDVATALGSVEAQAIRTNNAFRGISSSIESSLVSGLTDITTGAKSAGQGFQDMSNAIIKAIEQMIIKITIVEPMMRALQQAAGGLGIGTGGLGGLFGLGSANPLAGSVSSGTGLGAGTGGLAFPMFADGTDSAPGGWSIVGERGPELMRVPQGAQIVPNGQRPSNDNGWRGGSNVTIHNYTDASPQVSQAPNGDVTVVLRKMVDSMVGDSLSSGTGMRVLNQQYGVKQFAGR